MATLADYGPEVRAEVKQVREVVSNLHQQLIKWNLVVWTAGNVSQRLHTADLFVIKPSGLRYEYLTPSSMVVCDLDGNVVDGTEAPSSDTASHAYIYRNMPDVYGVVHTVPSDRLRGDRQGCRRDPQEVPEVPGRPHAEPWPLHHRQGC